MDWVPIRSAGQPAALLPAGWLQALPGTTIAAARTELVGADEATLDAAALVRYFDSHSAVGAQIGDGAGIAFSDFRIHSDGFARFVVGDRGLIPRQAGRMLQRLFEIEAYRMMALLALPIARRLAPRTLAIERALSALTGGIAAENGDDESLLHELTQLAAGVEGELTSSDFRFGACRAYHALVVTRIAELREHRVAGIQTIEEFMARRLNPAVETCATVTPPA